MESNMQKQINLGKKEKGNRVLKCKGKERQKLRKEKSKGSIKNVFLSM